MAIIKIKSSKQDATDTVATTMQGQTQELSAAKISTEAEMRKQDPAILSEEKERRTVNSKVYRRNNGTAKAIYMQYPLHYEKNGELEEIDSTLTDTGAVYAAQQGEYKIEVAKTSAQNGTVRLSDSDISIEWNYLPSAEEENATVTLEQAVPETTAAQRANAAFSYGTDNNDTELKYSLFGGNIKENIVIHEKKEAYRFEFELKTNGVTMQLSEDNTGIIFYKAGSDTKIAEIPSPFMYDATGLVSDEVYYELEEESEGMYRFAVVASEDWINDAARVFPVTVDPQIITQDSSYITKQVQYRLCSCGSGGSTSGWYTTSNTYIKVSKDSTMEYRTILTVQKSKFDFLDYPITSVHLVLKPYRISQSGNCYIGNKYTYISGTSAKSIDITTTFNGASGDFTLYVQPASSYINTEFYFSGTNAPMIQIEYLVNGKEKPIVQEFTLAGGLAGQYDIYTGDASIAFEDVSASDSMLGVGISHVYKKSADSLQVGKNFRLSLHETLSKTGADALNADYVYTDSMGMKHGFKDTYYYIDASGQKISVNKSLVSVDLNGKFTYEKGDETFEVKKEQRTKSGLTAITQYEDFKGVEWLEQRLDEQKQLEQQIDTYRNTLNEFVAVDRYNGTILCSLKDKYSDEYLYDAFMGCVSGSNLLLTKSDALSLQSVCLQKSSLTDQLVSLDHQKTSLGYSETSLYYQYMTMENTKPQEPREKKEGEPVDPVDNAVYYNVNEQNTYNGKIKENLSAQHAFIATNKEDVKNSIDNTSDQRSLLDAQIDYYAEKSKNYKNQIEDYYKEYVNLKHQLDLLTLQTPVNYLTDGKIVKGFNKDGNLVAVFDQYENSLTVEYDESGKIVNVYDGEDKQISFEYRPDGLLGSITDTRGRRTEYDYDDGKLTSVKKPGGKELAFVYDTNEPDNLIRVTTSDKMRSELQYTDGLLSKVITKSLVSGIVHGEEPATAEVEISACSFTHSDALTIIANEKNDRKVYQFNGEKIYAYYEEKDGKVVTAELYDYEVYKKDNVQYAKKDSLYQKSYESFSGNDFVGGDTQNTVLDEFNNPATVTTNERALSTGTTTQTTVNYTYNDDHKCIKEEAVVTVKEGTSVLKTYTQVTAYNYNAAGSVVRKESYIVGEELTTGKSIEETEYDANGNAVRSFSYNSLDSSSKFYTESEVAENGQTLADYDETGENKTEYEYISGTNVVRSQKLPNGSKFAYGYDENDVVTSISQSTEEGEENSTHTRYTCGEVTELVSGNNVVRYAYDAKRRLTQVYLNDLESVYLQNTYTDDMTQDGITGTVEKCVSTNAKNERVTSYTDKQGKVRRITTPAGKDIDYGYNAKGETTSVTDGVSGKTESYTYDDTYDRLTNYTRKAGETAEYAEAYTYDAYGQVSSVAQSGAATRTYSYVYKENAAHDLASIGTGTYKFWPQTDKSGRNAGREITESDVKLAAEYIYYRKVGDHATNMPSAVYFGKKSGDKFPIAESIKYKYDKMGNICRLDENGAPVVWYKYDALNRLVREDNKSFGKTWLYSYDNKGNILCKRETSFTLKENAEESEFTSVQYEYDGDKLLSYGTEECVYDEIGNPKTYRGKDVSWSNGRQMVNYSGTAFTYDGLGRRLSKGSINYTYDSNGRIIKQSNGIEFLYDNSGVAGIVYNNATYLYRKDAQGNICAILDSNGNVVVQYKYDAWGNHSVQDANGADINDAAHIGSINPFRYRGYYYDTEIGLYYLKSRYYDPEVGRFITIDDISYLNPEIINGLNLYAYCGNNPVMRIDQNGNAWWHWLLGGLLIVAITVATVVTAGAAAAILGAGAAVVKGVMVGAAIGGLLGGGFELIGQGVQSNWQSLDFGALAIETFVGAAYGAISGAAGSTTSAGLRLAMRGARVALSGVGTFLHGINNGDSWNTIWRDSVTSMIFSGAMQIFFLGADWWRGYTTTANIMAIAMDKTIAYGIKEMFMTGAILMGKSLWRFFGDDIVNIYKQTFSLIF